MESSASTIFLKMTRKYEKYNLISIIKKSIKYYTYTNFILF